MFLGLIQEFFSKALELCILVKLKTNYAMCGLCLNSNDMNTLINKSHNLKLSVLILD